VGFKFQNYTHFNKTITFQIKQQMHQNN